jgi:hypothetical protein
MIKSRMLRNYVYKEKVTGVWRKLHIEELQNLYSSPNIIRLINLRRIRWVGHAARMGEINAYKILAIKRDGKKPLGRPKHRRDDNIKIYLKEIRSSDVIWLRVGNSTGIL